MRSQLLRFIFLSGVLAAPSVLAAKECAELQDAEALIKASMARTRFEDDFKLKTKIDSDREGYRTTRHMVFYLRGSTGREFMTLTTEPKTEAGNGYLRIGRNLWFYDAKLGRWDRRTERERLGGDLVASDFGQDNLLEDYDVAYDGEEKVNGALLKKVKLKAKPDADVAFPMLRAWLDENCLARRQEAFTAEGRLMRTTHIDTMSKVKSKKLNREFFYPSVLRFVDEVEKDRKSVVTIQQFDMSPFPRNIFTKAWLESRSR